MHDPILPEENRAPALEEKEETTRSKRQQRWKIFGWIVIGFMASLLLLNQFMFVNPNLNRIALIVLFVAYIVYVILRRR